MLQLISISYFIMLRHKTLEDNTKTKQFFLSAHTEECR